MSVEHQGHETKVRPYPISVPWPYPAVDRGDGRKLRQELGIAVDASVAVGVDRADYTKGILERLAAVEELLMDHPELLGRFVFVQIAAPSRSASSVTGTSSVKWRRLRLGSTAVSEASRISQ